MILNSQKDPAARYPGYDMEIREDGAVVISGKGAGLSISALILVGVMLPFFCFPVGFWLIGDGYSGPVYLIVGCTLSVAILYMLNRIKSPKFAFEIGSDALTVRGFTYRFDDITEIFVDNPQQKGGPVVSGNGILIGGTGAAGVTVAATTAAFTAGAVALAQASQAAGAKTNYQVKIRVGAAEIPLARYLTKNTALALFYMLTRGA